MESLLDALNTLQRGDLPRTLSRQLGSDEGRTQSALSEALPLLIGALARNASRPEGARSLATALSRDHDGSILDDPTRAVSAAEAGVGDGILRHVLGGRRQAVETELGRASGLDAAAVSKLLATLAPLVMGALGRTQRRQGLDESGLASTLAGERRRAEQAAPAGYGMLAKLLDADRDGQIGDDVARIGSGLFRRLFGSRR